MKAVIFNADDFGLRAETNAVVLRAHVEGVLTSASLMVSEPGASEAVAMARDHPALAVGLHLALTDGCAALPPSAIPHLADVKGRFRADPFRAGVLYAVSRKARRELAAEIEAQFARFAATGLPCDHVNGHQHLHVHPAVWPLVLRQCEACGVRRLRLPCEEWRPATRGRRAGRWAEWLFLRVMRQRIGRALTGHGYTIADRVYGHLETGRMTAGYVVNLLDRLGGALNEVYLHPGTPHAAPLPGGPPGMDLDLDALLSPVVHARIQALGLRLTTYSGETP